ncbi:MAG TPA: SufE family protein [Chromatiales bacterium]|nr:SufE family protein [Thiotrichales bacterium]HIP69421.1 SufE family protein [Chromatiales bacterium]
MTDIDSIANDFELLSDWDQRYEYLIELGEQMPFMPESEMTEDNRVFPCMSKVWVHAYRKPDNPNLIYFHGDCDTAIIKGVVALLVQLFSGKTAKQIIDMDVDKLFERIQLAENLSPNRHVGIYAIVEVMKSQVKALSSSGIGLKEEAKVQSQ